MHNTGNVTAMYRVTNITIDVIHDENPLLTTNQRLLLRTSYILEPERYIIMAITIDFVTDVSVLVFCVYNKKLQYTDVKGLMKSVSITSFVHHRVYFSTVKGPAQNTS